MVTTTTRVRRTREVRDILRRDFYVVTTRFPGGREIERRKVRTRRRAFIAAREVNRPQTSPTAASAVQVYSPDAESYTTTDNFKFTSEIYIEQQR